MFKQAHLVNSLLSQNIYRVSSFFIVLTVFLFHVPNVAAAAITSTACTSGCNWSSGSSWSGGTVPGAGDTITIADGATMTADTSETIGNSSTTTPAINLGNTGTLIVALGATITVRGNVTFTAGGSYNTPGVIMNAGSSWQFDASQATVPATTKFRYGSSGLFQMRGFMINGTAGHHVSVSSNAGGGNGYFAIGTSDYYGFPFAATYADFLRIGDATNPGWRLQPYYEVSYWNVQHSTFTNCGIIDWQGVGFWGNSIFVHDYNVHTGTLGSYDFLVSADTALSGAGATREIVGNVFDMPINNDNLGFQDFTITDNYFGDRIRPIQSSNWAQFARNFVRDSSATANELILSAGPMTDNYIFWDSDVSNPHWITMPLTNQSITYSGQVIDQGGHSYTDLGDVYLSNNPTYGPATFTIQNTITVPDSAGSTPGDLVTMFGSQPNSSFIINHNTEYLSGYGLVDFETGSVTAGSLLSLKNNLLWGYAGQTFYKIFDPHGFVQDVANPVNLDYNAGSNYTATSLACTSCTNQAKGYSSNWSTPPLAPHDIDITSPSFIDVSRNLATFDSAYLGNTASTWSSSGSYPLNSFVSNSVAGFYNGTSINYHCINASGCDASIANSQPGSGSAWRTYWEFASLYRIRIAMANQTMYQPNSLNGLSSPALITPTILSWVRHGFSSTNQALKGAASDGTDIGAMPVVDPPDTTPPAVTLTVPSNNSTVSGSSVTFTVTSTDNVAVTGVQFAVDGVNVGSLGTTSPYSITWNSGSVSDGVHAITAAAHDAALNFATSSISVTVNNTPPVISLLSSGTPTATSTTITWTTDKNANSQINYGLTTSYGTASSSAVFSTSHSITLSGLTATTTYHFQVQSVDAQGNTATSTDQTFTTVAVPVIIPPTITPTVTIGGNGPPVVSTPQIIAPTSANGSTSSVVTQNVSGTTASVPWNGVVLSRAAKGSFVTSLQKQLVTLGYLPADAVTGYFGTATQAAVEKFQHVKNIVSSGTPKTTGYGAVGQKTWTAVMSATTETDSVTTTATTSATRNTIEVAVFTNDLQLGDISVDVKALQQYLNTHGFPIAQIGSGSVGQETTRFGILTYRALKKFQAAQGLPVTGYFGSATRQVING